MSSQATRTISSCVYWIQRVGKGILSAGCSQPELPRSKESASRHFYGGSDSGRKLRHDLLLNLYHIL
jgi:hypothetical protein